MASDVTPPGLDPTITKREVVLTVTVHAVTPFLKGREETRSWPCDASAWE
jgi:hypothetical protein